MYLGGSRCERACGLAGSGVGGSASRDSAVSCGIRSLCLRSPSLLLLAPGDAPVAGPLAQPAQLVPPRVRRLRLVPVGDTAAAALGNGRRGGNERNSLPSRLPLSRIHRPDHVVASLWASRATNSSGSRRRPGLFCRPPAGTSTSPLPRPPERGASNWLALAEAAHRPVKVAGCRQ